MSIYVPPFTRPTLEPPSPSRPSTPCTSPRGKGPCTGPSERVFFTVHSTVDFPLRPNPYSQRSSPFRPRHSPSTLSTHVNPLTLLSHPDLGLCFPGLLRLRNGGSETPRSVPTTEGHSPLPSQSATSPPPTGLSRAPWGSGTGSGWEERSERGPWGGRCIGWGCDAGDEDRTGLG